MDFTAVFNAVKENPTGALLVLALFAIAWLVRKIFDIVERYDREKQARHEAHLATAMQTAPLAAKMVDALALLERLVASRGITS